MKILQKGIIWIIFLNFALLFSSESDSLNSTNLKLKQGKSYVFQYENESTTEIDKNLKAFLNIIADSLKSNIGSEIRIVTHCYIKTESIYSENERAKQKKIDRKIKMMKDSNSLDHISGVNIGNKNFNSIIKDSSNSSLTISKERAKTITRFLISKGVKKSSIWATSKGDLEPIADNRTEEGRKKNNRVVITYVFR